MELTHQLTSLARGTAEYFPPEHGTHSLEAVDPAIVEYFPVPQSVHSSPVPIISTLQLPLGQSEH